MKTSLKLACHFFTNSLNVVCYKIPIALKLPQCQLFFVDNISLKNILWVSNREGGAESKMYKRGGIVGGVGEHAQGVGLKTILLLDKTFSKVSQ